jgi:hypothetical protein
MKYTIRENENHTYTLLRYGEPVKSNGGMPNNAELEFWQKVQELEEKIRLLNNRLLIHED